MPRLIWITFVDVCKKNKQTNKQKKPIGTLADFFKVILINSVAVSFMAGGAKRDVDGDDDDDDDKDDNNYDCGNDYDCDDNDYDNDNEDESSLYLHVISILVFTTRLHGLKKFI